MKDRRWLMGFLGMSLVGCMGAEETVVGAPQTLPVPPGEHPTQLALTADRVCVLTSAGRVFCHMATPAASPPFGPALEVAGIDDAVSLTGTELTVCALRRGGGVQCFGSNPAGLFRDGSGVDSATPVDLTDLPRLKGLSMGAFHACGLTATQSSDRGLVCWGDDADGKAGPVDPTDPPQFFLDLLVYSGSASVGGGLGPLTAGQVHSCVGLRQSATGPYGVGCFGNPMFGRLGIDDDEAEANILQTPAAVTQIAMGETHTCVLLEDHTVSCFGFNAKGQIGVIGTDTKHLVPVADLENVAQLAAGDDFTCARRFDGTVACWGSNFQGQFGTTETAGGPTVVEVPELTDAVDLAAASAHVCALRTEGELVCWGDAESSAAAQPPKPVALAAALTGPATPGARGEVAVSPEEANPTNVDHPSTEGLPLPVYLPEPTLAPGAQICESTCRHVYEDCAVVLTAQDTSYSKLECVSGCQAGAFGTLTRDCLAVSACDALNACFGLED